MSIQARSPGEGSVYPPLIPPTPTSFLDTSTWTKHDSKSKTTFETITKSCDCIYPTTTTTKYPHTTTSAAAVLPPPNHDDSGLAPGVIGGIVIGAFFGLILLVLLCIFCFRAARSGRRYDDLSPASSPSPRRRRPRPHNPYPNRPEANLTFVGGGNRRETKVVMTQSSRYFVRPPPNVRLSRPAPRPPPPVKETRRVTSRRERIVVV